MTFASPEIIRKLVSPHGRVAIQRAREFATVPAHQAIEKLRLEFDRDLAAAAFATVGLQERAAPRFSRAKEMLFTAEALEQCSGELVAAHSAQRFAPWSSVSDLCCGIGGDAISLANAISAERGSLTAIDLDGVRLACLEHNLEVYGCRDRCVVLESDVRSTEPRSPVVFIDPSRRLDGARVRGGEQYSPPLSFILNLMERVDGLCAKLSPGLALEAAALPVEKEFVSLDGVCREMLLWSGALRTCGRRATVLRRVPGAWRTTAETLTATADASEPLDAVSGLPLVGDTLLEPDPAVIRAGLIEAVGCELGARVLDPQIAYLIAAPDVSTPFAASYRVVDSFPFSQKRLQGWLFERRVGRLTVKKRGFPLTPEAVRARLKLKGDSEATIVLTRQGDRHIAIAVEPRRRSVNAAPAGEAVSDALPLPPIDRPSR